MSNELEYLAGLLSHQEAHHESAEEPSFGLIGRGRVEIISGGKTRQRWSRQEKARITRESFGPAARAADVARRNDISQGVLYQWRKQARDAGGGGAMFVPVQVDDKQPAAAPRA